MKTRKHQEVDASIIKTLDYRAIFSSGLTVHQLYNFLLTNREVDFTYFQKRLKALLRKKQLEFDAKNGAYHKKGLKPFAWKIASSNASTLFKHCTDVFEVLAEVKWIHFLGVSGSVAAHSAGKNDDIDIFIITKRNRLWLTRLLTVFILKLYNLYPSQTNARRKICPNFYIDDASLIWPSNQRNVYVAHEIVMLQPVIDRGNMYFRFLKANSWVFTQYFGNLKVALPPKFPALVRPRSPIYNFLEHLCRVAQMRYMRKAQTIEITTQHMIHFKKQDHQPTILDALDSWHSPS